MKPRALLVGPLVLCAALVGCASTPPSDSASTFQVAPGDYERTFAAAKDVVRDAGFSLERVDAERGLISTRARPSAGLATPWIQHATTPGAALSGVLHRERRIVEVRFVPEDESSPGPGAEGADRPIRASVRVIVQRLGAPGRHPEPTSIRLTSRWTPGVEAESRDHRTPFNSIEERLDPALSRELTAKIQKAALIGHADAPQEQPAPDQPT